MTHHCFQSFNSSIPVWSSKSMMKWWNEMMKWWKVWWNLIYQSPIKVDVFGKLLPEHFDDLAVLQYLDFGFPLGLSEDSVLYPVLKNHSNSYEYLSHIDKFIYTELEFSGMIGPFYSAPFDPIMTSPLMTAVKKLYLMPHSVITH